MFQFIFFANQFGPIRSDLIKNALVQQMQVEEQAIKRAKGDLESALAQDLPMEDLITVLEAANKRFKDQMKHATMHLPKGKAKAKAKAAPV